MNRKIIYRLLLTVALFVSSATAAIATNSTGAVVAPQITINCDSLRQQLQSALGVRVEITLDAGGNGSCAISVYTSSSNEEVEVAINNLFTASNIPLKAKVTGGGGISGLPTAVLVDQR